MEIPRPKKFINVFIPYQKQDIKLQKEQNDLILKNTKITIIIGTIAILAQVAEVISNILFR